MEELINLENDKITIDNEIIANHNQLTMAHTKKAAILAKREWLALAAAVALCKF